MMQVCTTWCKGFSQAYCESETYALVHLLIHEVVALHIVGFCYQEASWSSSCLWTEELCNQHPSQVGG